MGFKGEQGQKPTRTDHVWEYEVQIRVDRFQRAKELKYLGFLVTEKIEIFKEINAIIGIQR